MNPLFIAVGSILLIVVWCVALLKYIDMTQKRVLREYKDKQLGVEVCLEEVTVFLPDGRRVAHWVNTEWEEDPSIVPAIIHAVIMAYEDPETLIRMNQKHIDDQK